ncbi:unnamed protein product [Cercospora beticola]|nr:unnamed protein product [Cercospora beticola]
MASDLAASLDSAISLLRCLLKTSLLLLNKYSIVGKSELFDKSLKLNLIKSLSKAISLLILSRNLLNFNLAILNSLVDKVVTNVNILSSRVRFTITTNLNS